MQLQPITHSALKQLYAQTDSLGLFADSADYRYSVIDNARLLNVLCDMPKSDETIDTAEKCVQLILSAQSEKGYFYQFLDSKSGPVKLNFQVNLCVANGYALQALGNFLRSFDASEETSEAVSRAIRTSFAAIPSINSLEGISRALIGMLHFNKAIPNIDNSSVILMLANKLATNFRRESFAAWTWFDYRLCLTDVIACRAMLYAANETQNKSYLEIARKTMCFLNETLFEQDEILVAVTSSFKSPLTKATPQRTVDFTEMLNCLVEFQNQFGTFDTVLTRIYGWFEGENCVGKSILTSDGAVSEIGGETNAVDSLITLETINALNRFTNREAIVKPEVVRKAGDKIAIISEEIKALSRKIEAVPELYMSITKSPLYIAGQLETHAEDRLGEHLGFLRSQYSAYLQSRGISA